MVNEDLTGKQYILGYTVRIDCGQVRILKAGERFDKKSVWERLSL